jgi:hypothetical protein
MRQQERRQEEEDEYQYRKEQNTQSNTDPKLQELLNRLDSIENNKDNNQNNNSTRLEQENKQLKYEIDQLSSLKERITSEFSELTKKNELIQSNMQILNQRELEINTRENNVLQLVETYKQILNSRFYQMNVTSKDNSSQYKYFFNNIPNITSLKLISYSLPQARYNIDMNNNILKYKMISTEDINEEFKEIIIPKGKYTIESLISYINDESRNSDLDFKLNINQKITISSSNNFVVDFNNLMTNVIGFKDNNVPTLIDNKYIIEADNTWDLRVNDKLFLYITNINDDPISILYFNGNCESQIQFEEPIELSQLDIELRDVYGNLYDFNNLKHTINFQFELTNQFNDIVNIPNNISMVV